MLTFNLRLRRQGFELACEATLQRGVTGLFGPSGSGKSTLLHCLAGLVRPDEGRIELDGRSLYDSTRRQWTPPHRRGIGVVFQDGRLFPHLTVRGNLLYGFRLIPPGERRFELDEAVALLELEGLLDQPVDRLSGGERQRVALGRSLLASPRLLLLDEPLANLDWRLKAGILPYLRRIQATTSLPMLHVSHDLEEVVYLSDRIMLMEKGRLAARGSFDTLLRDPAALERLGPGGGINAFTATVCRHDREMGWTLLEVSPRQDQGQVQGQGPAILIKTACQPGLAPGEQVRMILKPQDITLASERIHAISMQNQLPGRVEQLYHLADRILCRVDAGVPLLAEVTPQSVAELQLAIGRPVVCLFKTHGSRILGGIPAGNAQPSLSSESQPGDPDQQQAG